MYEGVERLAAGDPLLAGISAEVIYRRESEGDVVVETVSGTAIVSGIAEPAAGHCPVSGVRGLATKIDPTVGNHVRESTWEHLIGLDEVFFCPDSNCPVVYFDSEIRHIWGIEDLKTRVGVKSDLDPVPVCYCRRVTRAQIAYEILERGCCDSVKDIKEFTKANTGELCLVTNPSGRCCGAHVRRIVGEIVEMRGEHDELAREARQAAEEIPY